jgi:hypothetical protein
VRAFLYSGGVFLGKRADGRWKLGVSPFGITWTLPAGGAVCFKPPWSRPYFSERYGCGVRFIFRLWGFRLFVREASQ